MSAPRDGSDGVPLLRPKPQRHWQITPVSTEPVTPRSPSTEAANVSAGDNKPVPRSRSILNLTASTLFGIYSSPSEPNFRSDDLSPPATPWGARSGTATPQTSHSPQSPRHSVEDHRRDPLYQAVEQAKQRQDSLQGNPWVTQPKTEKVTVTTALRNVLLLFGLGAGYGALLGQLHAETHVIPVRLVVLERYPGAHVLFWGLAAVLAGHALPRLDRWWGSRSGASEGRSAADDASLRGAAAWINILRCLCGFLGVAYVIRKMPWDSTLHASVTLALSNPVLWYVVDGSAPGVLLAAGAGAMGAALVAGLQPAWTAAPGMSGNATFVAERAGAGMAALGAAGVGVEAVAVGAWVASALFYACVCFGSVGRILVYR